MITGPRFQGISLPIASRVLKPSELLIGGILTRVGIGIFRVEENIPKPERKPQLSQQEKYASLLERIFVEGFGVPLHAASLYCSQEIPAKLLERYWLSKLPDVSLCKNLSVTEREAINGAIKSVYKHPGGIIAKQIYEHDSVTALVGNVRRKVARNMGKEGIQNLSPTVRKALDSLLMGYQRKLKVSAALTLSFGVLVSAFLSGYILQWVNDNLVSKKLNPWLLRQFGILSPPPIPQPRFQGYPPYPPSVPPVLPPYRAEWRSRM